MQRELADVLLELHDGLVEANRRAAPNLRISAVDMTLPMDFAPVLRDGGCTLLADVPRNGADAAWRRDASSLRVAWGAQPLPEHDA